MSEIDRVEALSTQLKSLSNPTRLKILQVMAKAGRIGTSDIEEAFGGDNGDGPPPAMWFHLHNLQRAGLVKTTRDGVSLRLEVNTQAIQDVAQALCKLLEAVEELST